MYLLVQVNPAQERPEATDIYKNHANEKQHGTRFEPKAKFASSCLEVRAHMPLLRALLKPQATRLTTFLGIGTPPSVHKGLGSANLPWFG